MSKRAQILLGMAAGLVWAIGLLIWTGQEFRPVKWGDPFRAVSSALAPGGLLMLLMIANLARRRFFDDSVVDGQPYAPGSRADIDQKVLANTMEQLVLAICTWPMIWHAMGAQTVYAVGFFFGISRLLFWIGYHISPPLRAFGFAAGFYMTVVFLLFSVLLTLGR